MPLATTPVLFPYCSRSFSPSHLIPTQTPVMPSGTPQMGESYRPAREATPAPSAERSARERVRVSADWAYHPGPATRCPYPQSLRRLEGRIDNSRWHWLGHTDLQIPNSSVCICQRTVQENGRSITGPTRRLVSSFGRSMALDRDQGLAREIRAQIQPLSPLTTTRGPRSSLRPQLQTRNDRGCMFLHQS